MRPVNIVYLLSFLKIFTLLLFVCIGYNGNAQKPGKPAIQEIRITDSVLVGQIRSMVNDIKLKDESFKNGKGYVTVALSALRRTAVNPINQHVIDTVASYFLFTSHMSLYGAENSLGDIFPPYYGKVDSVMVFIYDQGLAGSFFGYEEKSKKVLEKKLIPYLGDKASRKIINLKWERRVFILKDVNTGQSLPPYVINIEH